jgi:CHAD domain-containing protein
MQGARSLPDGPLPDGAALVASALRLRSGRSLSELAKFAALGDDARAHAPRVALRRLLAVLELAAALDVPAPRKLVRRLERALASLSPLRDLEVQKKALAAMTDDEPELAASATELEHERAALARSLSKELARFATAHVERALEKTAERLEALPSPPSAVKLVLLARVERAYTKFARRRRAVCGGDPRGLHRARVAFKQYRYVVEAAMPFLPARAARELPLMKELQDELGGLQDTSVLLATLRRAASFRRRLGAKRTRTLLARLERQHELRAQSMGRALAAQAAADPPAFSRIFV